LTKNNLHAQPNEEIDKGARKANTTSSHYIRIWRHLRSWKSSTIWLLGKTIKLGKDSGGAGSETTTYLKNQ